MNKLTKTLFSTGSLLAGISACSMGPDTVLSEAESEIGVALTVIEGNPTCAELGYGYEGKIDSPAFGQVLVVNLPGGESVTFSSTPNGLEVLSWTSSIALDAVIVKAGPRANVYTYDPEATSGAGLLTPINDGGNPAQISHLSFCYDFELEVAKTAETSFARDFGWGITKSASDSALLLSLAQIFDVAYEVVVSTTGFSDSAWAVAGTVTVHNPDPGNAAMVTSVTDELAGFGPIALDCGGIAFPYELAAGASLICSYATALPDGANRLNTATATAADDSLVGSGAGTADVVFSAEASTVTETDACVDVTDSLVGDLGTVCASEGSHLFAYSLPTGSATCGAYDVMNTATFTAPSGETGSASTTVAVEVPCVDGCSLTQGYWKTHSSFGPAPLDDSWAGKEHTTFFLSGATYYEVLWTPTAGNPYYNLAHQYIAAEMNGLNGANLAAVQAAFDAATAILAAYTPAQMGELKKKSLLAKQILSLAGQLDAYNNGVTGPGHCSE